MFWGFRLILFLYIGCFLQNQPENVCKVFLKLFFKIKYCIDYQQMKSMCKRNFFINSWMELTLTALIKAIILHWGRGSSSGDKQLKTQQKSSKFKMHQLPRLPLSKVPNPTRKLREQNVSIQFLTFPVQLSDPFKSDSFPNHGVRSLHHHSHLLFANSQFSHTISLRESFVIT